MTQITNTNRNSSSDQVFGSANSLNELGMDDFLDLMIAELQNQDPLNPLENDELIAQISQIREVGATEGLTNTLNAVLLGQNIASATNLIGADVVALDETGGRVAGNVQVVTIVDGQPKLELAVSPGAEASTTEGSVDDGSYNYAVVWETESGDNYGIEISATTSSLLGFDGSIELENLPQTGGIKRIYRTDRSGSGDRLLVGSVGGDSTTFTDTKSDAELSDEILSGEVFKLDYADKVTVTLDNVGEIRPPVTNPPTTSNDASEGEADDQTADESTTEDETTS